jgi:predicted enzyme related to lactoylglutathione lyase
VSAVLASGITIFSADLDAARAFYALKLDMEIEEDEDGFWARREDVVLRVEGGARPRRRGRTFFEEAGVMIRLETDDFDGVIGGLVGRGVRLFGDVKDSLEGRFAGFVDPDGNLFELVEIRD